MIYPVDFEAKIGFDSLRKLLISYCDGKLGKKEAENMRFSFDIDSISQKLNCVREMVNIKESSLPYFKPSSFDILPFLTEIKSLNSFVSPDKLNQVLSVINSFEEIRKFFDNEKDDETGISLFPSLMHEIKDLSTFPTISALISKTIDKFGEVKDTASPELYEVRRQIKNAQGSIHGILRRVMDRAIAAGIIEKDTSHSIRDGRMVIPVNAAQKRQINGIIHDESSTGKTVYIEPAEVVEASNKLRELFIAEKREVTLILISIADEIRPFLDDITKSCYILGKLDFIEAKSRVAIELNASLPNIGSKPELEWYSARHPGLELSLKQQNRRVVPLSLQLDGNKRILIISGPNAGGKSVTLKTVACVQYMMQCGLLPTLNYNSHMGIFKNIFIDIGDEQSFENDLSTYSSHLKNMRYFLSHSNKYTLLLADEMGSGTEPVIGGAIAQAILAKLADSHCFAIVTTHFHNLKTFAENTPGFVNGAMLYDRAKLEPTFELSIGNAGSSFALDIAHKMGLPIEVIESAKQIAGNDYISLEKYLAEIARDRKYWASKRQNIREKEAKLERLLSNYESVAGDLTAQRKAIINEARKEAKEILDSTNAKIERTILEIRKVQAEKEKTKQLRNELKKFADENILSDKIKTSPKEIKTLKHKSKKSSKVAERPEISHPKKEICEGDYVRLDDGNNTGQVISIKGKKAEVNFGALRMDVDIARLKLSSKPKEKPLSSNFNISSSTSEQSRERQLNFRNEIDVRGMRADEAIQAVTYFLDDAIQFNADKVRILHGTGHGILKTLIRQQLKSNPSVVSFGDEDIRFGGAGITVVQLL